MGSGHAPRRDRSGSNIAPTRYIPFPVEDYRVACEVDRLLDECERWDNLPAQRHFADECHICEAITIAEDLLPE